MKLLVAGALALLLAGCSTQQTVSSEYMAFPTNQEQENNFMQAAHHALGGEDGYIFSHMYLVRSTLGKGQWFCGLASKAAPDLKTFGMLYKNQKVAIYENGRLPEPCDLTKMPGSHGFKLSDERTYTPSAKNIEATECENQSNTDIPLFRPGAEITSRHFDMLGCVVIENGFFDGHDYSINHTHDSGRFYNSPPKHGVGDDIYWAVNCESNAITDQRVCTIRREGIFVYWSDEYRVMTTGDIYPLSTMSFRVDSNQAFSATEDRGLSNSNSRRLINQMIDGAEVTTRYKQWPYGTNVDTTFPTTGFSEAIEYSEQIR